MALRPKHFLLALAVMAMVALSFSPSSPVVGVARTTSARTPQDPAPLRRPRAASSSSSGHHGHKKSSASPSNMAFVAPLMAVREAIARMCKCTLPDDAGKLI
jgi:hypothetical protein